jgi:hypothetical protein
MYRLRFTVILLAAYTAVTAQGVALIKDGLKTVTVLDSSRKAVLVTVQPETYFNCDSLAGDWYTFSMSGYFDGWIHKDSIQFFHQFSRQRQQRQINRAIRLFSSVCYPVVETDDEYGSVRKAVYEKTYYPVLELFYDYYERTKDTATLLRLLKTVRCNPDGEFSQTFYYVAGQCYHNNKKLFVHMVRRQPQASTKALLKRVLISGILHYYVQAGFNRGFTEEQSEEYAEKEKDAALLLLNRKK